MPEIGGRFTRGPSRARRIWIINTVIVTGMYILFKAHKKLKLNREIYEMLLADRTLRYASQISFVTRLQLKLQFHNYGAVVDVEV